SVKEHASLNQHIDAIKLDTAKKARNKESVQVIQKNKNHIVGVIKIIYTLIRQDIPLAKFSYFIQMFCELESPFIMEGSITYENEVSSREFAFAIFNIIKADIWKEISEAVSFGIMIDKSTDISMNKYLVIYVIYPNSSSNIKTHFLQLLALNQSDVATITAKLISLFQNYIFASDSASVIIGNKN
ncbi:14388_t:CDS:2, partial [Dentiscutata erythropus]